MKLVVVKVKVKKKVLNDVPFERYYKVVKVLKDELERFYLSI